MPVKLDWNDLRRRLTQPPQRLSPPAATDSRSVPASHLGSQPLQPLSPSAATVAVSGWDLARGGPKPNRFAAQAGSTYFLNEPLHPWPETLSDNDRDAQQGWGCYLKGVWTDE
ncbi:MAG: hypothetical protein KJ000_13940 [Pirellulaceae bacterium]|nr:hypothetical protein [Pirellulaceae bacterium]